MTLRATDASRDEDAPRMERRPGTRTVTVRELIERAQRGELRIPTFQRPFRWENSDRIALLDSIDRGYPIGTMLFWQRRVDAGVGGLIDGESPPERTDAWLIIDGQQRLKTLVDALLVAPTPGRVAPAFNRATDRFVMHRYSPDGGAEFIPAHVLLDNSELSQWVIDHNIAKDSRKAVFDLGTRIRDYNVLAYVVVDEDEFVLRRVFERTNASGKALTREDVFDALKGTLAAGEIRGVRGVVAMIERQGYGSISENTAGNTLASLVGGYPDSDAAEKLGPKELGAALERTTRALAMALDFLRREAGIQSASVVPYQLPLVVLAVFFDRFEQCEPRTRALLRRWFWRGSLEERLSGASGTLVAHVRDALAEDEHRAAAALLARTGAAGHSDSAPRERFVLGHARSMLELCALLALRPRDLRTGEELDLHALLATANPLQAVRTIVEPARVSGHRFASSVANRIVHPSTGTSAARMILRCEDQASLVSHGVSEEALGALSRRDVGAFLDARRSTLARWFERFFAKQSEWGADDSPPLRSLLVHTQRSD